MNTVGRDIGFHVDITWTLQQYYFPLSKNDWKANQVYKQEKDVLTDLMKRDASGNIGFTVYFGKSRTDVGSKGNVYWKLSWDCDLFPKGGSCLPGQIVCDTISRFELSLTAEVKLSNKTGDTDRKRRVISLHLGLLADVVTLEFRLSKDKKKSLGSWSGYKPATEVTKPYGKEEFGLRWYKVNAELGSSFCCSVIVFS